MEATIKDLIDDFINECYNENIPLCKNCKYHYKMKSNINNKYYYVCISSVIEPILDELSIIDQEEYNNE